MSWLCRALKESAEKFAKRFTLAETYALKDHADVTKLTEQEWDKYYLQAKEELQKHNINCSVVNARFLKPIDEECIEKLTKDHNIIVTLEENVLTGGYGEAVLRFVNSCGLNAKVINIGIPNMYLEHGNVDVLKKEVGLTAENVVNRVLEEL